VNLGLLVIIIECPGACFPRPKDIAAFEITSPAADSREFIDYLVELGIFRERSEERIDVPDLYLSGLGLIRKGGVKRK
jgi:hypothetical protein